MKLDHELLSNSLELGDRQLTDLPRQDRLLTNPELPEELLPETDLQLLAEDKEDLLETDHSKLHLLDEGGQKDLLLPKPLDTLEKSEPLSDELSLNK